MTFTLSWSRETHVLSALLCCDATSTSVVMLLVDIALTESTCGSPRSTVRPPGLLTRFVRTSLNDLRKRNDVWRFFSPAPPPVNHINSHHPIIIIINIISFHFVNDVVAIDSSHLTASSSASWRSSSPPLSFVSGHASTIWRYDS